MMWFFAVLGLLLVVVIGLVIVGGETARLAAAPRPAVVDLADAVDYIADRLSPEAQARMSHDDVRWILLADADLLEEATADPTERRYPWSRRPRAVEARPLPDVDGDGGGGSGDTDLPVVDEDVAIARVIAAADEAGRELDDDDVAAVLVLRLRYLDVVGAVGSRAAGTDEDRRPG